MASKVFFQMAGSYESVEAYRPMHELQRNHHRLFKAVMTDITKPEQQTVENSMSNSVKS